MKKDKKHIDSWSDDDLLKSLPEVELPFSKSKEDVWAELSVSLEEKKPEQELPIRPEGKSLKLRSYFTAVAAILVLMLGTTAFLRFYAKTFVTGNGQHLTALLPDGSTIELNAGSSVQYHPYWWRFNRQVHFEGEGFFKVQKGKSFEVLSTKGRTMVLGTSFNIYARNGEYKVTCLTGKVRVISTKSGHSTDITPYQEAVIEQNGKVISRNKVNTNNIVSWTKGVFIYTATPLKKVFDEIERQYGISITVNGKLNDSYTGNFNRNQPVDEVMHNVCLPFGLHYQKVKNGYVVNK